MSEAGVLGVLLGGGGGGGLVVFFSEGKCYQKLEGIPNISRVCEIADPRAVLIGQCMIIGH